MARGAGHLEKGGLGSQSLENSLQGCSVRPSGKKRARTEQEKRGALAHCVEMMATLPSDDGYEETSEETAAFNAKQAESCRLMILMLGGA